MSLKINCYWEEIRILAFGDIDVDFAPLGPPLDNTSRNLSIVNQTDGLLVFSTDGVTDMFVCPAMVSRIWDLAAMRVATSEDAGVKTFTQIYVRGTPGSGDVYLETIYLG
jgi:hypothetical protein